VHANCARPGGADDSSGRCQVCGAQVADVQREQALNQQDEVRRKGQSLSRDSQTAGPVRPHLWNPSAAANWSLLFTPAFGAYLHAVNWRALGEHERARANMVWAGVTLAFLASNVGTLFIPESKAVEGAVRLAGLGLLGGWYFSQGRSQAKYIKERLRNNYVKRGWGPPLLVGVAASMAYGAGIYFLAVAAYNPGPDELAAEVKPLILAEWQKEPERRGASIQNVTLVHKGGKVYTGFVDATLGGQSERLSLEVVYDRGTIAWELKPLSGK
jgi:hypothetical protein